MAAPISRKKRFRQWSFLLIPPFIVAFVGLLFLGVDQLCINDANRRLPYYPDAERVEANHNGLRVRGVGNSLEVVLTTDSEETVKAWYEARYIELLNTGRTRGLNTISHWFDVDAEGTKIFYLTQCVM